jgi:hypothetical protein
MKKRVLLRRIWQLSVASAVASAAFVSASAQAAPVTVGSPLTSAPVGSFGGTATEANVALGDPGARVTSPVTGTIVGYRVDVENDGRFAIRVIRPAAGGAYTGAGASDPVQLNGNGLRALSANLPIRAGDLIGLDLVDESSGVGQAEVTGSMVYEWGNLGFLANGATAPPNNTYEDFELLFNADVVASNSIAVGEMQRNKKKGTATVNLTVPNPGTLTASANGARVSSTISKSVAAGPVQLRIKAKGKKRKALDSKGKVKVTVALTYTPTLGDTSTQALKVKLKKKR